MYLLHTDPAGRVRPAELSGARLPLSLQTENRRTVGVPFLRKSACCQYGQLLAAYPRCLAGLEVRRMALHVSPASQVVPRSARPAFLALPPDPRVEHPPCQGHRLVRNLPPLASPARQKVPGGSKRAN